jgi:hypothetical protein
MNRLFNALSLGLELELTRPPGDSKNTVDKLTDTASSIGTNIKETTEHEAGKAQPQADKAGAKAESVGQNILDTGAQ